MAKIPGVSVFSRLTVGLFVFIFVPAFGLSPCSEAGAESRPAIIAVDSKFENGADSARLSIDLNRAVEARAFVLANPDRAVIELPAVNFSNAPFESATARGRVVTDGLVKTYRFGLFSSGRSRIVLDLAAPAKITHVSNEKIASGEPTRLKIELQRIDRKSFLELVAKEAPPPEAVVPAAPPHAPVAHQKPVIVLDPGHGGIDTGAVSSSGVTEKNVVLDFARTLAATISARGQYEVVLTRPDDVFISLDERVSRARAAGAALFISIHADTLADAPSVQGWTVYTASEKASDAEAARLAEKENLADVVAGMSKSSEQSDVNDILVDLTRRETRGYSHLFARSLVGLMQGAAVMNKNPERSAAFRVLRAPDFPSALIELGYLSNSKDVANLTSADWRTAVAGRVAEALDALFTAQAQDTAGERSGDLPTSRLH